MEVTVQTPTYINMTRGWWLQDDIIPAAKESEIESKPQNSENKLICYSRKG